MDVDSWDLVLRIGLAALAGAAVGLERDLRGHPAGLRTHALVSTGAALFTVAGLVDWGAGDMAMVDPTRIAAQVVSGIGFIGAGAILRDGLGVKGLTTATTIWMSGALGVGFGTGNYTLAGGALAIVLAILVVLRALRDVTAKVGFTSVSIDIRYETGHGTMAPIMDHIETLGVSIDHLSIDDTPHSDRPDQRRLRLDVSGRRSQFSALDGIALEIQNRPEVREVHVTSPRD